MGEFVKEDVDEYTDEDDPGFEIFNCNEENFAKLSMELAENYGFPQRACIVKKTPDPRVKINPDQNQSSQELTT